MEEPDNIGESLERVREELKDGDINLVCINDGPKNVCDLLKAEAEKRGVTARLVRDDRPIEEQRRNPYYLGKVIEID